MGKTVDKIKKILSKKKKEVKEEGKNTKDLPMAEYSHPEYEADIPLNKQRHLR